MSRYYVIVEHVKTALDGRVKLQIGNSIRHCRISHTNRILQSHRLSCLQLLDHLPGIAAIGLHGTLVGGKVKNEGSLAIVGREVEGLHEVVMYFTLTGCPHISGSRNRPLPIMSSGDPVAYDECNRHRRVQLNIASMYNIPDGIVPALE